jgi:hypothetical protein
MKKRLLITSIVMMLVVAVALSTATYAWFTSNSKVEAKSMTLTAATSDADALGIGWIGGNAGTVISFDIAETLKPMAPADLTANTTTSDVLFYNATIREENSVQVFNNDLKASYVLATGTAQSGKTYYEKVGGLYVEKTGLTVGESDVSSYYLKNFAPVVYHNATTQAFYVKNPSTANTVDSITVSAVFDGYFKTADVAIADGKTYYTYDGTSYTEVASPVVGDIANYYEVATGDSLVRVAIFTKAQSSGTSDATNYKLLGVLASVADANTVYGAEGLFDDGDQVGSLSVFSAQTSYTLVTNLAPEKQVDIVAIAWLDGTALNDDNAGKVGNVKLQFTAA